MLFDGGNDARSDEMVYQEVAGLLRSAPHRINFGITTTLSHKFKFHVPIYQEDR